MRVKLVIAAIVLAGLTAAALASGKSVLVSAHIRKGSSAFALLQCGYFTGFSVRTESFVWTPEATTSCPIIGRL